MLPLSYAVKNLTRSFSRTMQMIAGSTLVVVLIMNAMAFNQGIDNSLSATGNPKNVILIARGSEESTMRSQISASVPGIVSAGIKGIRKELGMTAVSAEIQHMGLLKKSIEDRVDREVLFRGVTLNALLVHNQVAIGEGQFPGTGEILAGRQAARMLELTKEKLAVGKTVYIENEPFKISGIFDAPGTIMDAEIWMPLNDLKTLTLRESISYCIVSMDEADYADIKLFSRQRLDLELSAIPETDFYSNLITYYNPIKKMTWITALLIVMGALFGGLNTMYAAFISRIREFATLQAMGFSRFSILVSMFLEAVLTALLGTVTAMAICLFLLRGITIPFATGVFSLEYNIEILLMALATGIGLGIIGILVPAWNCLKPPIVLSLRS